ncbi:MAG: fructosamine kinase family protein [Gammaproteobacteria bacterium]|nr:fructosamine kinase family protein [Gammaproteobacteria bacterium]
MAEQISTATGKLFTIENQRSVGGGSINAAYRIEGSGQVFFLKLHDSSMQDMFSAEAEGLDELANTNAIRVPKPVCWGIVESSSFLVMEYLELGTAGDQQALGNRLADMHRNQASDNHFGWHRDNTIGATPQPNSPADNWTDFWRDRRLGFQLELAAKKGASSSLQDKGEALLHGFPALFNEYNPPPSLLHGDLWSGNYAFTRLGEPSIFDPAVYYGDREADIAMTELFGGFGPDFYTAYNKAWPLDDGYQTRKILYNLYHILNHFNLFGGGYASQAESMIEQLLKELR